MAEELADLPERDSTHYGTQLRFEERARATRKERMKREAHGLARVGLSDDRRELVKCERDDRPLDDRKHMVSARQVHVPHAQGRYGPRIPNRAMALSFMRDGPHDVHPEVLAAASGSCSRSELECVCAHAQHWLRIAAERGYVIANAMLQLAVVDDALKRWLLDSKTRKKLNTTVRAKELGVRKETYLSVFNLVVGMLRQRHIEAHKRYRRAMGTGGASKMLLWKYGPRLVETTTPRPENARRVAALPVEFLP
jgi:hypothetical protein